MGKSELAMAIAARIPSVIVSLDSRQIYRGMAIGTAQPSPADRAAVPHRGVAEREIDAPWTAGEAARDAARWLRDAWGEGRLPIVTGGSGLYLQAAIGGLDLDRSPPDPALRRRLEEGLRSEGLETLVGQLESLSPGGSKRIDAANPRRVIRAIELLHSGARAGGDLGREPRPMAGPRVVLALPRDALVSRIDARVEAMFEAGLVEETQRLVEEWGDDALARLPTVGYDQVRAHLRGECSLGDTIGAVKAATRRYAKRQMTWFRKYGGFEAIDLSDRGVALERVLELVGDS